MKRQAVKIWHWLRNEERSIWFEYSLLALAILLPLLPAGYILTLDMVFTPHFAWPSEPTSTYLFEVLLWLLNWVLPGDVIQKIILFLILIFSGVGAHLLVARLKPASNIPLETWRLAAYFAGIFYMLNPFTYARFMAGQWLVLAGYALLPFVLLALLKLLARPGWQNALKLASWTFAVLTLSLHHVGMLLMLGAIVVGIGTANYWQNRPALKRFLGSVSIAGLVVTVLTSFWWLPALTGQGSQGQAVANFNQADVAAFATSGHGGLGAVGDVVRLQGFWAEAQQLFTLPQAITPLWGLAVLALWVLVIIGAVKTWRTHRTMVTIAVSCVILGIILAATPLISWLAQAIPPLAGYREPHKFANLVALGYAILGAFGTARAAAWAGRRFKAMGSQVVIVLCVLLPLVITPTMLWGFAGQLTPRHYPPEWHHMNKKLNAAGQPKTLFLPWHQYMSFGFSQRIIASPAEKFFETRMLASDQPEFKNVSPTVPNSEKQAITKALTQPQTLVKTLQKIGIKRILLAKEHDFKEYDYLNSLSNVQLVHEDAKLKLYQIGDNQ